MKPLLERSEVGWLCLWMFACSLSTLKSRCWPVPRPYLPLASSCFIGKVVDVGKRWLFLTCLIRSIFSLNSSASILGECGSLDLQLGYRWDLKLPSNIDNHFSWCPFFCFLRGLCALPRIADGRNRFPMPSWEALSFAKGGLLIDGDRWPLCSRRVAHLFSKWQSMAHFLAKTFCYVIRLRCWSILSLLLFFFILPSLMLAILRTVLASPLTEF